MALLLLESKRDDLLLPYFELVKSKNPQITFGQFKSNLLEHLTQNGGLRNLSLASNYYLAGAARYYFNGDLTLNKDLALFYPYTPNSQLETAVNNGEETIQNHKDNWNTEICKTLNKIILLLRNSYIDTVGETFEQPEDFGKLKISQLIRKYGSKISKLKSEDFDDEENKMNLSDRVSPNYTFEIMYSHEDCKKFYEATNPGAWCITYGQNHYDGYVNRLNIHYVIFKRDGWENVPRTPEKDKWVKSVGLPKPQDDYGNSLIAMLQSNKNGEPIYITSRWNHGASDCGSVEADHAYTKEEFMRITGVSNDELQRIFEIWAKTSKNRTRTNAEMSELLKSTVRRLKEFQMRVNGGADIVDYMEKFDIGIKRTLFDEETDSFSPQMLKKGAFVLSTADSDGTMYYFIMDKGKIIFESILNATKMYEGINDFIIPKDFTNENVRIDNSIIIPSEKYFMIYNYRYHNFLDVRGDKKFKRIPLPYDCNSYKYSKTEKNMFFEVKKGKFDIALINVQTQKPLVLPNGDVWFNEVECANSSFGYEPQNKIFSHFLGSFDKPVFEIVYDMSSREKYFYNCLHRRFFDVKENNDFTPASVIRNNSLKLEPVLTSGNWYSNGGKGIYGIKYKVVGAWGSFENTTPSTYYDALTDEPISINGLKYFDNMSTMDCEEPILRIAVKHVLEGSFNANESMKEKIAFFQKIFPKRLEEIVYDKKLNKPLAVNGKILEFYEIRTNKNIIFFYLKGTNELIPEELRYSRCVILYDTKKHAFIKNESGFPNEKLFVFDHLETWGDYENGVIGYYFPNMEVKKSDETIDIRPYVTIKKGCLELNENKLTYYPTEFNDYTEEYIRLFGNDEAEHETQEIVQEDIRRMVEQVIKNLLIK